MAPHGVVSTGALTPESFGFDTPETTPLSFSTNSATPPPKTLRKLSRSGAADADESDGAELTLYVWREFCESPTPPPISAPSVHEVVERVKTLMSARKEV
jgi:hypothetical protein